MVKRNIRDIFFASIAVLMIAHGCGATSQEPCTQADIAQIIAEHEARLASKCVGQGKDCHERKAEDARFREELRGWVRCDEQGSPP
jgi:hypothetical protein